MDNVLNLGKVPKFPVEAEFAKRLNDLVSEYEGRLSLVAALGILELMKSQLLSDAK